MRIVGPHVKSVPFADDASAVIRIIVVKHTLLFQHSDSVLGLIFASLTYNPPIAKHAMISHLFLFDKDNLYNNGIGKHKM